jgi:hypothetical protein
MSIYTPDLSGENWSYYVNDYQRTIFRYPQKILFDIPIFENDKLTVTKLGTVNVTLTKGVDYVINEDDIDYDAISVCKNMDSSFDKILLKSLTILTFNENIFKIQVTFNQLFADSINYAAINREQEIEVTPTLVANIVAQVAYLQQMVLNYGETFSEQSSITKVALNEYPDGDNDDNLIVNELHDINTLDNKTLIRPIYGSFFKDSVSIKNTLSNEVFGVDDFEVQDLDISRTKTTSNESGVFRLIKIKKEYVGQLGVDYRAYGGVADVASIRSIQGQLSVIESFLSKTSYITPATISADPTIVNILNKLQELDGTMRLLLQNGLPSYGDVTTGTAVLKKVTAQDANLHWWTIGTLYRVEGSSDNVLADVFKFRLKSLLSNMMFECSVSVNVSDNADRIRVNCDNSNLPDDVLNKYCPKLRILEVKNGGIYSGVVLQLGMKLGAGILQETFDIEDMSGRESCWKLVAFNSESVPPEDTGVLMPNGSAVFAYGDTNSLFNEATIPFKSGMNIMNSANNIALDLGSINAGTIKTTYDNDLIFQTLDEVDLDVVKSLSIDTAVDIGETEAFPVVINIPITAKNSNDKFWSGSVKSLDLGFAQYNVGVSLYLNNENKYTIKFDMSSSDTARTLNVTAIKLMF